MKPYSIIAAMLIVATGAFGQGTPTEGEQTLTISGKVWPRWELDHWHSAYKTTGVILSRCKPTIYVAGIAAGSPGEAAGLKTNDVVLLVGTNEASRMSLGEINRAMTFEELKKKESNQASQAIGAPQPER